MRSMLRSPWLHGATIFLLCVAALGPSLPMLEFSGGMENLNIATALETHRDGSWLIPKLENEPRLNKPPLPSWITAAFIRPVTVKDMSSTNAAIRESAYGRLAWESRISGLLFAGLMLAAAYALGRAMVDSTFGWMTGLICGSSYISLRYGRTNANDIYMAAFVTIANAAAAYAMFRGRHWIGWPIWGIAVGLALMSKGPAALAQTVAPLLILVVWRAMASRGTVAGLGEADRPGAPTPATKWLLPVVVGFLLMLAVALPWPIYVLRTFGWDMIAKWAEQVNSIDAGPDDPDKWYAYMRFFYLMLPWIVFFIGGLVMAITHAFISRAPAPPAAETLPHDNLASLLKFTTAGPISSPSVLPYESKQMHLPHLGVSPHRWQMLYAALLVIVPLVIMSFFNNRKERYALPMAVPAAALTAFAVRHALRNRPRFTRGDNLAAAGHWLIVGTVAVGLPIVAATPLLLRAGQNSQPWLTGTAAALCAGAAGILLFAGLAAHRIWRLGMAAATFGLMILSLYVFLAGYRYTREGSSEMKPLAQHIWEKSPSAKLYNAYTIRPKRAPLDLSIYANRTVTMIPFDELSTLQAGNVPLVAVVRQKAGDKRPVPPRDWRPLGNAVPLDKDRYWAFELRAKGDTRRR